MRRRSLIRDEKTAFEFAVDAYLYLYPLVVMDVTRRRMTAVGGPNAFAPVAQTDLARPCLDMLQSSAWLDVSHEPMVLSVPDGGDRYYLAPIVDMWTDLVAAPGTRTSGNWPADYAIVGRDWDGPLPERLRRIEAPTPMLWARACVQRSCAGADFQDGLAITPLSEWTGKPAHRLAPTAGGMSGTDDSATPAEAVDAMDAESFFARAAELLAVNPPHVHDHAALLRSERIGIAPGQAFEPRFLPRAVAGVLPAAVTQARFELHRRAQQLGWTRNGWIVGTGTMGVWGTDYLKRAAVASSALGAVMPEDVVITTARVDEEKRPLDGRHRYRIRFAPSELPPVLAFWSLTAYDERGRAVPSELGRRSVASDRPLGRAPDGSLEVAVQHRPPDGASSNWLPCPEGRFSICLRLYWPEREVLERTWTAPPVQRVRQPASESTGPVHTAAVSGH